MSDDRHPMGTRHPYGPLAPVPIFQWEPEFTELLQFYASRRPRRVLEVGTFHGGTLYHWLRWARPGATVVSLDSYAAGVDNRLLYSGWAPEGVILHSLAGDSHNPNTVSVVAAYAPFDWIFIDAGHYYHEVKADWELYRPFANPGAVVCFHDILPPSDEHPEIEVERLWREIQREGYMTREIVHDPDASWGGIGIVFIS